MQPFEAHWRRRWMSCIFMAFTPLPEGHSLNTFTQIVHFQNTRHSDRYFVKTTLYDGLNGIKKANVRLRS